MKTVNMGISYKNVHIYSGSDLLKVFKTDNVGNVIVDDGIVGATYIFLVPSNPEYTRVLRYNGDAYAENTTNENEAYKYNIIARIV